MQYEVFSHADRGFDDRWRPDALSRSGNDNCCLPEADDDPYWVRINCKAENIRRRTNADGMILEQLLCLE